MSRYTDDTGCEFDSDQERDADDGEPRWMRECGERLICSDAERSTWLDARKAYVGGSDVAVLFDLSSYKTRDVLLLEKAGLGDGFDMGRPGEIRRRMENFVATDLFSWMYGWKVQPCGWLIEDAVCKHLATTPDFTMEMPDGNLATLDVKVVRSKPRELCEQFTKGGRPSTEKYRDGMPLDLNLQLQSQMSVLGPRCKYGALLVFHLVPDLIPVAYWTPRHDGVIRAIHTKVTAFAAEVEAVKAGKLRVA